MAKEKLAAQSGLPADTGVVLASVQHDAQALSTENLRLAQQVSQLRTALAEHTETYDRQLGQLRASVRDLEHENSELRFLNTQYIQNLRTLEIESRGKTEHIDRLMKKNLTTVVEVPNGSKQTTATHKQRIQIRGFLEPRDPRSRAERPPAAAPPSQHQVSLLQEAEEKITQLEDTVQSLRYAQAQTQDQVVSLQEQVRCRVLTRGPILRPTRSRRRHRHLVSSR